MPHVVWKSLQWLSLICCCAWIYYLKAPLLYRLHSIEEALPLAILLTCLVCLGRDFWLRRSSLERMGFAYFLLATSLWMGYKTWDFYRHQDLLRRVDPEALKRVGQHLMVGYTRREELLPLVDSGAIGGIFITARNVQGQSAQDIRQFLQELQTRRQARNLPPLWIAADQEGGGVSRLSPPLPRRPYLRELIAQEPASSQQKRLFDHGLAMGQEMLDLGINVNFAPVVDLQPAQEPKWNVSTQISKRAIAPEPQAVIDGARPFIRGLQQAGVQATLKHFPGLAGVQVDTHLKAGELSQSLTALRQQDWQPFKQLLHSEKPWLMVGHVRVPELDPQALSSFSAPGISGLIRQEWGFQGVIVTDDLCMGPTFDRGIGRSAKEALNAGVDLVLVAYDPRQSLRVLAALIQADAMGGLSSQQLQRSKVRLSHVPIQKKNRGSH